MANPAALITKAPASAPEAATAIITNPFVRAAQQTRAPFSDLTTQIGASGVRKGPIDVAAMGYMRGIEFQVETDGTGAGGSAVAGQDGVWAALEAISIEDVAGRPLINPMSGYHCYLMHKWGGYSGSEYDPANFPSYSAIDANGEFSFALRLPIEITERDALGALPNLTASATYKLHYTVAAESAIYATAPVTTTPSVRVRATVEVWSQPRGTDPRGMPNETAPPQSGTAQYWTSSTTNVAAGEQRIKFGRMGNLVRNLICVYRDDAGTPQRTTAEFPDSVRIEWDNKILDSFTKAQWLDQMRQRFGQNADEGVFVYDFTHDADGRPGNENRHGYLPTVAGTRLELIGSFGGSGGVLTLLTNDVAPSGPVALQSGQPGN